jgi:outer membrane protein assembly factor BamD
MKRALLLATMMALGSAACGGGKGSGKVDYSVSAQQNYERGLAELEEEDWIAAAKYFSFIKARFPYSKYAVLAELRLADAEYGADHFLQAIDAYKQFIKFHPSHEMVQNGYCSFRIGEAYVQMLPDDMWILPPAHEKDQSASMDAHRELTEFSRKYPRSPHQPKAKKLLIRVNKKLAGHEMYVAKFYWKNDRPMGTVLRLRRLLERHAGAGYDQEALYLLGKAYMEIDEPKRAQQVWQRLVKEYPDDDRADEVRDRLPRGGS